MSKTPQSLGNIGMLVWLFVFWSLMIIFANYFQVGIVDGTVDNILESTTVYTVDGKPVIDSSKDMNIYEVGGDDKSILNLVLNGLNKLPILKHVVPLANIMLFRVTAEVPYALSILLNLVMVITVLSLFNFFIRPLMGGS